MSNCEGRSAVPDAVAVKLMRLGQPELSRKYEFGRPGPKMLPSPLCDPTATLESSVPLHATEAAADGRYIMNVALVLTRATESGDEAAGIFRSTRRKPKSAESASGPVGITCRIVRSCQFGTPLTVH